LRARDWSSSKAFKLLQGTIEWRRSFKPNLIEAKNISNEASTGKLFHHGSDSLGRPVIYMTPARENSKDYEKNIQLLVYTIESAIAAMPPNVEQVCV
jgi:hypothetical protein